MSVCFIPPYTPLIYSKTGVYRVIHYFLIFCSKTYIVGTRFFFVFLLLFFLVFFFFFFFHMKIHKSIVVEAVLTCTHNICFRAKI